MLTAGDEAESRTAFRMKNRIITVRPALRTAWLEHPRDDPGTDHFPTVCGSRNLPGAARRAYCRDW